MWKKQGLIFTTVSTDKSWQRSHAQVPVVDFIGDNKIRVYYGTRDSNNRTLSTFFETKADNPSKISYIHQEPILPLGKLGTFDESGVMPSDIVDYKGIKFYYYLGWNTGSTVRYRVANGLAISKDGGKTFRRF